MLCAEPTIAGTKLEENYCDLVEEHAKLENEKLGGGKEIREEAQAIAEQQAEADARALDEQRKHLEAAGIYIPAL